MQPITPRLLTPEEVSEIAGIKRRTLYRLISVGQFPRGIKVGGKRRWHPEELNDYWKTVSQGRQRNRQ